MGKFCQIDGKTGGDSMILRDVVSYNVENSTIQQYYTNNRSLVFVQNHESNTSYPNKNKNRKLKVFTESLIKRDSQAFRVTTEMLYQRVFYMECQKILRELRAQQLFQNTDDSFAKESPMPLVYNYKEYKSRSSTEPQKLQTVTKYGKFIEKDLQEV